MLSIFAKNHPVVRSQTGNFWSDMDFANSSQAKQFLFSKDTLDEKRTTAFENVGKNFPITWTAEQHLAYVNYYCNLLLENSRKLGFNRYQRYTALMLMQRVYLSATVWEIPAPLAMIGCLFLVAKFVTPVGVDPFLAKLDYGDDFMQKFKPDENMQKCEVSILTAIDFKLRVHLPFHQIDLIARKLGIQDDRCGAAAFDILKTDAMFLYPPGVVAIAACAKVCGLDQTLAVVRELEVPIPENIAEAVDDILSLPYVVATKDEIDQAENAMGDELALFHTLQNQESAEQKQDISAPTAMLPP